MILLKELSEILSSSNTLIIEELKIKYNKEFTLDSVLNSSEIDFLVLKFKNQLFNKNIFDINIINFDLENIKYIELIDHICLSINGSMNLHDTLYSEVQMIKKSEGKYNLLDENEKELLLKIKLSSMESIIKIITHLNKDNHKFGDIDIVLKKYLKNSEGVDTSIYDNTWKKTFNDDDQSSTAYWNTD